MVVKEPLHWCHVYVFAWLEAPTAVPPLDDVLDCDKWRFAVLSHASMHRASVEGRTMHQKTVGLATLKQLATFVHGSELPSLITAISTDDVEGVPSKASAAPYRSKTGAVPIQAVVQSQPDEVAIVEYVPSSTVDWPAERNMSRAVRVEGS